MQDLPLIHFNFLAQRPILNLLKPPCLPKTPVESFFLSILGFFDFRILLSGSWILGFLDSRVLFSGSRIPGFSSRNCVSRSSFRILFSFLGFFSRILGCCSRILGFSSLILGFPSDSRTLLSDARISYMSHKHPLPKNWPTFRVLSKNDDVRASEQIP